MFSKIKKWLFKPYPFPITNKTKVLISLAFGIFITLFLFRPFDYYKLIGDETLIYSSIYGLISGSVILLVSNEVKTMHFSASRFSF